MLLSLNRKRDPIVRLVRVHTTTSGKTWIFDFVDPVHQFAQSIIAPKFVDPQHIEACYEKLWTDWSQRIKEDNWKQGKADVFPIVQ